MEQLVTWLTWAIQRGLLSLWIQHMICNLCHWSKRVTMHKKPNKKCKVNCNEQVKSYLGTKFAPMISTQEHRVHEATFLHPSVSSGRCTGTYGGIYSDIRWSDFSWLPSEMFQCVSLSPFTNEWVNSSEIKCHFACKESRWMLLPDSWYRIEVYKPKKTSAQGPK